MKKYILVLLLLSCQEEELIKIKNPFMTISNAIPVQFWVNGVETYNEKQICGVEPVCFCQPFNSTDEIRLQFLDSTGKNYSINILDVNDNILEVLFFDETLTGVYSISFTPSDFGITDEFISLVIKETVMGAWTNGTANSPPSDQFQTVVGSLASSVGATAVTNDSFHKAYAAPANSPLSVSVRITSTNLIGSVSVVLKLHDAGLTNIASSISYPVTYEGVYTLTATASFTVAYVEVRITTVSATVDWTVEAININGEGTEIAKSDCLDIKTSHDCTELIQYTNADDFNNIVYLTSPTSEYSLRIPAQFWKEDNPMEQEDSELSNGVIKTRRQTITQKRYLEIGYMPNYMHLKTQLALMHDTVTIDGSQWKKRDAYESESIKRYPLKRANVWLTLYNSIDDNIL